MSIKYIIVLGVICFTIVNGARHSVLKENPNLSSPEECRRTCVSGEPPKTCYYHFTLERYTSLGGACLQCQIDENNTTCTNPQCILSNGIERTLFSTNRMVPGPEIQVCKGDKVIVDVKNDVYGSGITIHWHGVAQRGTPYSDGVPYLTQCPIENGNTFRYIWNASNAGTHFWHSHTGLHKMNGLYGTLVIREPQTEDVSGHLYDYDLPEHVIFVNDILHEDSSERLPGHLTGDFIGQNPASFLINGKGQYENNKDGTVTNTPLQLYNVQPGKRYRFRLINSMAGACPGVLTVEGHSLTVISSDGEPVKPVQVDSIVSFSGERYDFILETNQSVGAYWLQLRGLASCWSLNVQQLAILQYDGSKLSTMTARPSIDKGLPLGTMLNPLDYDCTGPDANGICIDQLEFADEVDTDVMKTEPDVRLYLPFRFFYYEPEQLFVQDRYSRFLVKSSGKFATTLINGISFRPPTSPPLSQLEDIPPELFCNGDNRPADCQETCTCTHVYDVPLNSIVEVVFIDEAAEANSSHPFHLHGQSYYVTGLGQLTTGNITGEDVKKWDKAGLITRNLVNPPKKDTLAVPNNGYAIVRFKADNPGFWIFHCHFMYHVAIGMNFVIHVGTQADLPPVPENYPKCGDFLPPID